VKKRLITASAFALTVAAHTCASATSASDAPQSECVRSMLTIVEMSSSEPAQPDTLEVENVAMGSLALPCGWPTTRHRKTHQ
jgi:hypothetical protein